MQVSINDILMHSADVVSNADIMETAKRTTDLVNSSDTETSDKVRGHF